MNSSSKMSNSSAGKVSWFAVFFRSLGHKVVSLFEPEEVEVTFKVEGNKTTYTYTKVSQKQVA
jgi:hypothetical protein